MDEHELDERSAEGLLSGDPEALAAHPHLADVLGDVRVAYRRDGSFGATALATPVVALGAPQVSTRHGGTTTMTTHARRAARVLVGALVALLATAGLAVAGALPAPLPVQLASDDTEVPDDPVVDEDPVPDDDADDDDADADDDADDDADAADANSHGKEVSELARTTELRGCEKGRAVSFLASGREVEERKPCPHADDASDDGDDGDDSEDPPEATADDGPGHGRSADAPGHTKRS
jgi:hypothetical protein